MKIFLAHFLIFFTSTTIEATNRGRCVDSDGHKYRPGQGYEDKCTEFTCAEVGGNLHLVASPSPDCCWHAGKDYSTGDTVSSAWSPTEEEEGCAETIVKCESVNGSATLAHETIRGHYCVHNGEKVSVGERVPLAQKCSWLVCNHHLINGVKTPSLDLVVDYPGCDCCLDQAGAMQPDGTNVTSKKLFCNNGIWEDSTGLVLRNGSSAYSQWLNPPTSPRLEVYAWSIQNPEDVAAGAKPVLEEVGPFVYIPATLKDPTFNEDGETLTYRPRKFYHLLRGESVADPDTTFITVPNIPFFTAIHNLKDQQGFMFVIKAGVIQNNGRGTPFVNVSVSGFLWGYEDELPCIGANMAKPHNCPSPLDEVDLFDLDMDDDLDDFAWMARVRRDAEGRRDEMAEDDIIKGEKKFEKEIHMPVISETHVKSEYLDAVSAMDNFDDNFKAEYVNCSCLWGLFRDKNVTMREPVTMYHGTNDLAKKGWVKQFNGKDTMDWWKEGSYCDKVGGQDGNTFPPNVYTEDSHMEVFLSSMCRKIKLNYENKVIHGGIEALRFVTTENTLGSHRDPNPVKKNAENECFCMEENGLSCFKSGVYDLGPCKVTPGRPVGAPIAVSLPHFYQADTSFREAVDGMRPEKEKHQMYVDVEPELGIAVARQYRFQLNAVIRRNPNIPALANFLEETVVPFLWVQDGYSQPSRKMVNKIKKDLAV